MCATPPKDSGNNVTPLLQLVCGLSGCILASSDMIREVLLLFQQMSVIVQWLCCQIKL